MNQSLHKKIAIGAGILIVFIAAIVIIVNQLFWKPDRLLIDYLPAETEFWFWQRSEDFSDKLAKALEQLAVDSSIITALKDYTGEIVVYYLKGHWFRLENLGKKISFKEGSDIVGFLSQNYIGERLADFEFIFKPRPYYFALKQTEDALYFAFMHQEEFKFKQLAVFEPKKYPSEFLNNDAIILAVRLQEPTLLNSIVDTLTNNIIDFTAFDYPVVISKTLPDQTIITEKVVKPELFVWQEFDPNPNAYQLQLNQQEIEKFKLTDQLKVFKSNYNYYQDDQIAIFAQNSDWSKTAVFNSINSANFFYLNLLVDAELADLLGKSKTLSWLQDLAVKSIIVYEDERAGAVQGELKFNNL